MSSPEQLYIDATMLAMEITNRLGEAERSGELHRDHRLLKIGRKAWLRSNRRRRVLVEMGELPPLSAADERTFSV